MKRQKTQCPQRTQFLGLRNRIAGGNNSKYVWYLLLTSQVRLGNYEGAMWALETEWDQPPLPSRKQKGNPA